jgi:hypothetical protein
LFDFVSAPVQVLEDIEQEPIRAPVHAGGLAGGHHERAASQASQARSHNLGFPPARRFVAARLGVNLKQVAHVSRAEAVRRRLFVAARHRSARACFIFCA